MVAQGVRIAREAGAKRLGTLASDGTKPKANASRHKAMSCGRMRSEEKRLRGEITALTAKAAATDAAEDREHGVERRGDELPQDAG